MTFISFFTDPETHLVKWEISYKSHQQYRVKPRLSDCQNENPNSAKKNDLILNTDHRVSFTEHKTHDTGPIYSSNLDWNKARMSYSREKMLPILLNIFTLSILSFKLFHNASNDLKSWYGFTDHGLRITELLSELKSHNEVWNSPAWATQTPCP